MRRGKYNVAKKEDRTMDGIVFDSKREMLHYSELKMLERTGIIHDLELQPVFPLIVNGVQVCKYVADFRYKDQSGRVVIEDSKGAITALYRVKKKLFEALYSSLRVMEV